MNNALSSAKNSLGFSLIELLVSLVIASIIFGGVIQVALTGKRTAMDGEEISFIQDNARFVIEQIRRDTRAAGFMGCAGLDNSNTANAVANDLDGFINLRQGIQGFEGGVSDYPDEYESDVLAGTDSFLVRFADASQEYKVKSHNQVAAEFTLWTNQAIDAGTTMMVTDSSCRAVGLFQATGPGIDSNKLLHLPDGVHNCTSVIKSGIDEIGCSVSPSCTGVSCDGQSPSPYLSGASIMPYRSYAYYIGESDIVPDMPALKRRVLSAEAGVATTISEEIALGVEDLQIIYGVDLDADGVANRFIDADDVTDWTQVVSLRMTTVFRSNGEVFRDDQDVQIKLDGNDFVLSDDKFLRQVVSTTVRFRNL